MTEDLSEIGEAAEEKSRLGTMIFPLKFLLYLLYRLVRAIVLLESDFLASVKRLCTCEPCDVESLHILTRFRFDINDCARACDFIVFHDTFTTFSSILLPEWIIYDIDDSHVYLVKVPDTECTIDRYTKMGDFLLGCAEKAARVRIDTFIERSGRLPPFASRVVFIHSTPCSGGTVVARMLQACDPTYQNLCVYGEPPVITSLSLLSEKLSVEIVKRLALTSLRFSLHHQKNDQTIVYKCRLNSSRLIPYLHTAVPSILHCVVTTRSPDVAVSKLILRTSHETNVFQMLSRMRIEFPWLSETISRWTLMQMRCVQQVGPKDGFELAAALFIGSQIALEHCTPYLAIDPICFEDLMNDTARLLAPLVDLCELSDLHIPDAIAWKRTAAHEWRDDWDLCILDDRQLHRLEQLHELLRGDWNI